MDGVELIARLAGAGRHEGVGQYLDAAPGRDRVRRDAAGLLGVVVPHQLERAVLEERVLPDDEFRARADLASADETKKVGALAGDNKGNRRPYSGRS